MIFLITIIIIIVILIVYTLSWLYDKLSNPISFDFDQNKNRLVIKDNVRGTSKEIKFPVPKFDVSGGRLKVIMGDKIVQDIGILPKDNLVEFDKGSGDLIIRDVDGNITKRTSLIFKPPKVDVAGNVITITDTFGKKHVIDLLGKLPDIEIVGTKLLVKNSDGSTKRSFDIMRLAPEPNLFFIRDKYLFTKYIKTGEEEKLFDLSKLIPIMTVENNKLFVQTGDDKKMLFNFELLRGFSPVIFMRDDKLMITLPDGSDEMLFDMKKVLDRVPVIEMRGSKLVIDDEEVINFNKYVPVLVVEGSVLRVLYPDGTSDDLFDLMMLKRKAPVFTTDGTRIYTTNQEGEKTTVYDFSFIQTGIKTNAQHIQDNISKIADEVDRINTIIADITGLTDQYNSLKVALATQDERINSIVNKLTVNASSITDNASSIKGNAGKVASNASSIKSNADMIAGNVSSIKSNADMIAGNVSSIKGQTDRVTDNYNLINSVNSRLSGQVSRITYNHSLIDTLKKSVGGATPSSPNRDYINANRRIINTLVQQNDALRNKINELINRHIELSKSVNAIRGKAWNGLNKIHENRNSLGGSVRIPSPINKVVGFGAHMPGIGTQLQGWPSANTTAISTL